MNEGFVIWLTGIPGSGKSTIARKLESILRQNGTRVEILDGDEVRRNLSPELGFTKRDREIHASRVVYVSKLLARNGVVVVVALISPYRKFREYARKEIGNFVEVWVKCSVETCMKRDPKGLYRKAMDGQITDLTGLQDPYEEPLNPEVVIDTESETVEGAATLILSRLGQMKYLNLGT